jgi:hypothetical protein
MDADLRAGRVRHEGEPRRVSPIEQWGASDGGSVVGDWISGAIRRVWQRVSGRRVTMASASTVDTAPSQPTWLGMISDQAQLPHEDDWEHRLVP